MKANRTIQQDVIDELAWEPSLDAANIGVSVTDGVVMLSGFVRHYADKRTAEATAQQVLGVRAVANELQVRLADSEQRTDVDIAKAAIGALKWNVLIPHERIDVTVEDGTLTLRGTVEWQFQRSAAEEAVRHLNGVTGVTNEIEVKPPIKAAVIKHKIEAALKRRAALEADRIMVATHESTVVLRGTVDSWAERQAAIWAAWAAPGVTEVKNYIIVGQEQERAR